ncbi:beta-ketoacyl-[acyl-carrier-protein] synthase family protein [Patulibacter sp. SYSU D01012]|uniref:beta-ketoacyl-[acyl-carrier-protein] synthase family protein n=1 Tax=Patulibacter sp. SYSU D01012 TaxID=2817381 RepID=UPI001B312485|nr:beta-ketoacyl-[acyl-carrier-protein] synthase family protein [Patulibacter sp. SYSU D01012]
MPAPDRPTTLRPRVVVTGVGAVTALGVGAEELHRRWTAGDVGIVDGAGAATSFVPREHLTVKEARRADRFTQMAIVAADEALAAAGWGDEHAGLDPTRIGCVIGTGIGGLGTLEAQIDVHRDKGPQGLSPLGIPMLMGNAATGTVAMRHGLHGPGYATLSACAAGANAIGSGVRAIQAGDADAMLVGGSEATVTPYAQAAFAQMGASSPSGISRPFDARRDGFVMGEGAAVLVLEEETRARARGAAILGVVAGYGTTVDAHHLTAPEPDGRWAALAMTRALEDAGVGSDDVDYVNAHGTSTPLNDAAEARALRAALGARAATVPVSSTKSTLGHLLGAGGAVEAVATLLALRDAVAPPNLGYEQEDPEVGLRIVTGTALALDRPADRPLTALSNSFGFGGHNAVLCLQGA